MTDLLLRPATADDLDILVKIDLDDWLNGPSPVTFTDEDISDHRTKIADFVDSPGKGAWVLEDTQTAAQVGTIMGSFRDRVREPRTDITAFVYDLLADTCPTDVRFCEIFQMWVDPAYRRQGLATRLKRHIELESRERQASLVYTHTEATNDATIALNAKLGYREIRRGPIWDDVVRVSLVKRLDDIGPV